MQIDDIKKLEISDFRRLPHDELYEVAATLREHCDFHEVRAKTQYDLIDVMKKRIEILEKMLADHQLQHAIRRGEGLN